MDYLTRQPMLTISPEEAGPGLPAGGRSGVDAGGPGAFSDDDLYVLGVGISNFGREQAIARLTAMLNGPVDRARHVFIVNAHTLNLACEQPDYRQLLNTAEHVFADGTGIRWAARGRGRRIKANLVGTDLIPALFAATAGQGYRYFLLGADEVSIGRAAAHCRAACPGWELAGYHHGYLAPAELNSAAIEKINAARPHLLLVGMGNPLQERWIEANLSRLRVPLSIGVGGLFDHWAGNLQRAPAWVRRLGCEWLQLLAQQPHKWRRYLLGNPAFLWRIWRQRGPDLRLAARATYG